MNSTATVSRSPVAAPRARRRPELLAPAGDWECARAAVENGADAIYFGLERFNARMRARNFTQADLPALMEFLHRRGVRGYVTFNTLIFTPELADAEDYIRTIVAAGADAAIVQDVGACRLIRGISPDFPIHCSTQMTITSAAGVEFARKLGAQLVVLARENSLADIARINAAQATASVPLPLEVFVHGALCVAYSGQCLTSESLGGRSANRGECAQACRLPYDLIADGQQVPLGDRRYLLSPQDLSGLEVLSDLVQAGVASLKIEGRLKSPEYVASITRVYRQALDAVCGEVEGQASQVKGAGPTAESRGHGGGKLNLGVGPEPFDRRTARYELEMSFSRGLYPGWFRGNNNQELAHARFGTKRGVFLGEVLQVARESVTLRPVGPLKPGDGVVFDAGNPEEREEGGRIYQATAGRDGEMTLRFGHGDIDWRRVRPGQLVWKTNDPALDREVRTTFEGDKIRFQRPITLEVHGRDGTPLTVIANDGQGHVAQVASAIPLAPAEKQPLNPDRLREQLGRLGGTPFTLASLHSQLEGEVILPVSELNRLRRDVVAALDRLRATPKRWQSTEFQLPKFRNPESGVRTEPAAPPELIAVIRLPEQLEAAWSAGAHTVYCEFENPKHYRDTVTRFRALQGSGPTAGSSIWVAAPRIFKPGEEWILNQVRSCEADGYLVRTYDHLSCFAGDRKRGDFSLNVANQLTADYFLREHGLERVTASYDLNIQQLDALLQAAPPEWFDLTIHQHMPMFHMEHCVFCAFLSTGKDYRDCGRPCEKHRVALRDRVGAELPLRADAGCRNTVFNNRAQTGAEYVARFMELGARHFRVEFVNEDPTEVTRTLTQYQRLLRGEVTGGELWRELRLLNQLGVTRGQMEAAPQVIHRKR
ncbi:MAG: U32 family peptidase [Verrucomicrobia bacterium]|nr:U32 family peptidase [Verrucomicrobiota bacterium]